MISIDLRSIALFVLAGLAAGPAAAQTGDATIPQPVLKERDLATLQKQLQDWWEDELAINGLRNEIVQSGKRSASDEKKLKSLKKKAAKAKDKFRDTFEKKGEKVGGLLKHLGDLIAIWDECFVYESMPNGGRISTQYLDKRKKTGAFQWRFPKVYKPKERWPLVFSLPNRVEVRGKEQWNENYIEQAWPPGEKDGLGDKYIFACPKLPADMDLSSAVDPMKGVPATELERIQKVLGILGHVLVTLKIDSDRVFLEACGGSTPFALRLASTFPDRFAGLILKNPEGMGEAIPENLRNMAVAIVHDSSGADRSTVFEKRLKAAGHNNVFIKETKGAIPFGDVATDLAGWMDKVKRNLFTQQFTLTPAFDNFKRAYWVEITEMEAIADTGLEYRPKLEVKVDRAANRIEVTARKIGEVMFHLNDAIVDLDKPITFVLNGKSTEQQRQRSKRYFENPTSSLIVLRNEPRAVFVARARYKIPKPEGETDKEKDKDKAGDGTAENGGKGK